MKVRVLKKILFGVTALIVLAVLFMLLPSSFNLYRNGADLCFKYDSAKDSAQLIEDDFIVKGFRECSHPFLIEGTFDYTGATTADGGSIAMGVYDHQFIAQKWSSSDQLEWQTILSEYISAEKQILQFEDKSYVAVWLPHAKNDPLDWKEHIVTSAFIKILDENGNELYSLSPDITGEGEFKTFLSANELLIYREWGHDVNVIRLNSQGEMLNDYTVTSDGSTVRLLDALLLPEKTIFLAQIDEKDYVISLSNESGVDQKVPIESFDFKDYLATCAGQKILNDTQDQLFIVGETHPYKMDQSGEPEFSSSSNSRLCTVLFDLNTQKQISNYYDSSSLASEIFVDAIDLKNQTYMILSNLARESDIQLRVVDNQGNLLSAHQYGGLEDLKGLDLIKGEGETYYVLGEKDLSSADYGGYVFYNLVLGVDENGQTSLINRIQMMLVDGWDHITFWLTFRFLAGD